MLGSLESNIEWILLSFVVLHIFIAIAWSDITYLMDLNPGVFRFVAQVAIGAGVQRLTRRQERPPKTLLSPVVLIVVCDSSPGTLPLDGTELRRMNRLGHADLWWMHGCQGVRRWERRVCQQIIDGNRRDHGLWHCN
jgi:hypothetical protein